MSGGGSSAASGPWLSYAPGIDGLRALAVMAVLAYHYNERGPWLSGGFLGVEVFFVISGFLITALLLSEHRRTGHIDLRRFWIHRARRLFPALGLLLALVAVVAVIWFPEEVAALRGDILASLAYVMNWYHVFGEQSYFEAVGRPPLLRHLWSLAVEEQFYLIWPVVFGVAMRFVGRRWLLAGVVAGIVGSTLLLMALYAPGADPTRLYYGTDTRAAGLLVGVALAFVWSPWRLRSSTGRGGGILLDVLGLAALGLLASRLGAYGEFDPALYQGGFLMVALATAVVIAVVVHPAARLGDWLGASPLRWIGLRSYGIYLWHWPVFMLTRPELDVTWTPTTLFVVRMGATLALAELSFRLVEMPVRRGALVGLRQRVPRLRWAAVAAVLVVGLLAVLVARAPSPELAERLAPAPPQAPAVQDRPVPDGPGLLDGRPMSDVAVSDSATPDPDTSDSTAPDTTSPDTTAPDAAAPIGQLHAIGDSVLLGATNAIHEEFAPNTHVDAVVGRQVDVGLQILRGWRDAGVLGDVVVVHLGNNGLFTAEQFDEMMEILAEVPRVAVLTVRVPRSWESSVNETIVAGAEHHDNAVLVDWREHSDPHPDWFHDGMHLRPDGMAAYVALVAETLLR